VEKRSCGDYKITVVENFFCRVRKKWVRVTGKRTEVGVKLESESLSFLSDSFSNLDMEAMVEGGGAVEGEEQLKGSSG
jgi:hypothetical protein